MIKFFVLFILSLLSACELPSNSATPQEKTVEIEKTFSSQDEQIFDLSLPIYNDNFKPLPVYPNSETLIIDKHLDIKNKSPFRFSGEILFDTEQEDLFDKVDGGKVNMEMKF